MDSDAPRRARLRNRKKKSPENEHLPVPQKNGSNAKIRPAKKRKRNQAPLRGMVIAVSTLDVKGQSHSDSQYSYKAVADLCQQLGASITGQLHRRVSCLVCNEASVNNATQRVRKAVKKNVPLVDVEWVQKCQENDELVALDPYRLDDLALNVIESRIKEASRLPIADVGELLPDSGWSEPASLGCCCVCHENGDVNCPWCSDCSAKR